MRRRRETKPAPDSRSQAASARSKAGAVGAANHTIRAVIPFPRPNHHFHLVLHGDGEDAGRLVECEVAEFLVEVEGSHGSLPSGGGIGPCTYGDVVHTVA